MTDTQNITLAQMSQKLLGQLREGRWEEVAASSAPYMAAMQQIMSAYQQALIPEEKQAMAEQLQAVQANQVEIVERLRARVNLLEQHMVRLEQSRAGCRDYAAQSPRRFD